MELGFSLSSEEHRPGPLVDQARLGPDQEGFFRFYEREILPRMRTADAGAAGPG